MSLDHDFMLLDRETDGEWKFGRFRHGPRAINLSDDFIHYILDTLWWIPSTNPARREPHQGLCLYGPTLIEVEGAGIAEGVFASWADLLALGPTTLTLSGYFSATLGDDAVTLSDATRERLEFDRDALVATLRQLAAWCETVRDGGGRYYLYHQGI